MGVAAGLSTWVGTAITGAELSLADLLDAGINVVPVGILVLGLGTLIHGVAPRMATVFVYGLVAWSFVVEIIGAGLGASGWLLNLSVLHHIARAPAADVRWDSAAILTGLGILAAIVGALAPDPPRPQGHLNITRPPPRCPSLRAPAPEGRRFPGISRCCGRSRGLHGCRRRPAQHADAAQDASGAHLLRLER